MKNAIDIIDQKNLLRTASANLHNGKLEVLHNTINEYDNSGREKLVHKSEEVSICLRGIIEFEIENEKIRLEPLDSIQIEEECPHRWGNPGPGKAEILSVFSPPLFQPNGGM